VAYASIELMDGYYYLHKYYIDVSKHRKGIGTAFFNYLLTQLDTSLPIRLQVNRKNFKAVNFYFKMGFFIESVGDFDIGGGFYMNDFVMKKEPRLNSAKET
jgi:GNAT superfamily N-acetyltransferase